jgi:hypothetical protein
MATYYDPLALAGLPLSAYTPGQGDLKMEGGYETATGQPMYTFEQYLKGQAPYVTGAVSGKPSGQMVYRTIGDQVVPIRISDTGPGVKGIDIASSNSKWATNFPYQGQTDRTPIMPGANALSIAGMAGGPAAAAPVFGSAFGGSPAPVGGGMLAGADSGYKFGTGSNIGQMSGWQDYTKALTTQTPTEKAGAQIAGAFQQIGSQLAQQGQQGMNQAMSMVQRPSAAAQLLQRLINPQTAYPDYTTLLGG